MYFFTYTLVHGTNKINRTKTNEQSSVINFSNMNQNMV